MRRAFVVLFAFILAGAALAPAKPKPAANVVHGRVVDSRGEAVPAAQVFIQSADGTAPHAFKTDGDGRFARVVYAPKGLYDMRAEAGGLWSEWQHNVSVRSSAKAEVVLTLARTTPPSLPR